jgi:aryl-alcohol dehydrogenase-like predicted oxidoreductase
MQGGSDQAQSIKASQRAVDLGINLIDTAPVYAFGHSEEIVGKALSDVRRRDKAYWQRRWPWNGPTGMFYRN